MPFSAYIQPLLNQRSVTVKEKFSWSGYYWRVESFNRKMRDEFL